MGLSVEFSLLHSELNDFLFAQIGEEASGVPITVLSALTRLGIDPWAEGERLSDLPKYAAAQVLAPMIARFPREAGASETAALAERLAGLLPRRVDRVTGIPTDHRQPAGWRAARNRLAPFDLERRQWQARLSKPAWFVLGLGVSTLLLWLIGSFG